MNLATTTIAVLLATGAPAARAASIPVTTCGQVVMGVGELTGDLDCSADPGEAVKLTGRLLLNGFTLTGNPADDVVRCETGGCIVEGPGTVTGGMDGIRGDRTVKVRLGVIVTGNADTGVRAKASAIVSDSTITANGVDGIEADASVKLAGTTVTGNGGDGVRAKKRASLKTSTVSGNGGDGVRADGSATLSESSVADNGGDGVHAESRASVKLSSVTGNGFDGARGLKVTLKDATATGNGIDPACGVSDDCADVASELPPAVSAASACDTSRRTEDGGTWGVCAAD